MSLADIYILRPKKTFVQFKQEFNHLRDPVILSKGSEGGKKTLDMMEDVKDFKRLRVPSCHAD